MSFDIRWIAPWRAMTARRCVAMTAASIEAARIYHLFTTSNETGLNLSVSQGEGAFVDGLSGF
jgi:hypothetical protein